jgi:hypothetical protein
MVLEQKYEERKLWNLYVKNLEYFPFFLNNEYTE